MNARRTALLLSLCLPACSPRPPDPEVISCDSASIASAFEAVDLTSFDAAFDGDDAKTRDDLARYLNRLWTASIDLHAGKPDEAKAWGLWASTSAEAIALTGKTIPPHGYALERIDTGTRHVFVIAAHDADALRTGTYAFLEELGARFFHPMQEFLPKLGGARLPRTLDVVRAPAYKDRGLQPHTLHPIEYFKTFMEPGETNLADAKRFIDWLAKTGQNRLQFPLLASVPFEPWRVHAAAIVDYAHSRGVKVSPVVQVWAGSSLQNNFVLLQQATDPPESSHVQLDKLFSVPWDGLELALGEFSGADPEAILRVLDHVVAYVSTTHPGVDVGVQNHVGNYDNLWVDFRGQRTFFYHVPAFADPRLGSSVHTLSFFDLYRDWATYAHPDFHLQREFLLSQLGHRRVWYFPESAYWINADIDVPLFLPMTIYARWLDMSRLQADARDRALPPLDGHMTFTSGHEWNYWLTDYLIAHQTWNPDVSFQQLVGRYAAVYGNCSGDVETLFEAFTALQNDVLFDRKLAGYVQGEDLIVDLGYLAGLETHPRRAPFESIAKLTADERAKFATDVIDPLVMFADRSVPMVEALAARCRGADLELQPWCEELLDGVKITSLRARHEATLYRAAVEHANGGPDVEKLMGLAQELTTAAQKVIDRREPRYRFEQERLTGAYKNPTVYDYGLLRQAHTLCYWSRREQQLRYLIDTGDAISVDRLPTCAN